MPNLTVWSPRILSILRIITALLFMEHGLMKIAHFPAEQPGLPSPLTPLLIAAAIIEIAGGLMLTIGLFTRIVAFVCAGEMAAAYFMAHLPKSVWPAVNGGDTAIMFCFVFLYLVFAGPGEWSLDAQLRKAP